MLQRELKKIRGKGVMVIVVVTTTAPRTVDDAETAELYTLEKSIQDHF